MKKRASRLLSALLVLCMLSTLMPGTALAANGDFVTEPIENGIRLVEYTGSDSVVTIPDTVTEIGDYAFIGCSNLTSLNIPATVRSIGQYAFYACENLTEIIVASDSAYYSSTDGVLFSNDDTLLCAYPAGKSEETYTVPSTVTTIGSSAFSWCNNLTSVTIPDGVGIIASDAFSHCAGLTSVIFPVSVVSIGDYAFYECVGLTDVTFSAGVTSIGESAFAGCTGITCVSIPSTVTYIGDLAFFGVPITNVNIPSSVTSIGEMAFGYNLNAERNSVVIWGNAGTAAERYARDNGFTLIPATGTASPTRQGPVTIISPSLEGGQKEISFQMYALKDSKGNPINYVKLRDLALELSGTEASFEVSWERVGNGIVVNLVTGMPYTPNGSEHKTSFSGDRSYKLPLNPTRIDGKNSGLQAFVLTADSGGDFTYYKLRDLGRMLDFNVGWSAERGIYIETDKPYTDAD